MTRMKLSPAWRKALVVTHVVTAVGWLGSDAAQLTLGIAGLSGSARAEVVYPAMNLVGTLLFVPLSVAVWLVAVVSASLSPWGLLRYRWVVTKLVIATLMLGLVFAALLPLLQKAGDLGGALPSADRRNLVVAPAVSTSLLIIATILSIYKPWGRVKRSGTGRAPRATARPAPGAPSGPGGTRTERADPARTA